MKYVLGLLIALCMTLGCSRIDDVRSRAEQGDMDAQFELGWRYADGKGVTQSYPEAVKWYLKASEQGHKEATARLQALGR